MNILFVHSSRHQAAPWLDGSTRYRCYHLAEALRLQGVTADVSALSELPLEHIDRYDRVCVLRPQSGRTLDQLLKRCQRSGVATLADVDDLIFDPEYAAQSPSVVNRQARHMSVHARYEHNLQALLRFDELIVATQPLADHWREQTHRSNVSVVPNGLSLRWLTTPVRRAPDDESPHRTITYLPGSSSHDKDFSEINDILAETLHGNKDVRLQIVGALNIDDRLFPPRQVSTSKWVDYYQLPQIITSSSVTLAPLARSPFTHAKSHIKFIESAAFGTPAICSPNHDICRHVSPGLFIAHDTNDWYTALNQSLHRPVSRTILDAMQTHIRHTSTAGQSADILIRILKNSGLRLPVQVA